MPDYNTSATNPETRITFKLSQSLKRAFKVKVAQEDLDMSDVIRRLIIEYLEK